MPRRRPGRRGGRAAAEPLPEPGLAARIILREVQGAFRDVGAGRVAGGSTVPPAPRTSGSAAGRLTSLTGGRGPPISPYHVAGLSDRSHVPGGGDTVTRRWAAACSAGAKGGDLARGVACSPRRPAALMEITSPRSCRARWRARRHSPRRRVVQPVAPTMTSMMVAPGRPRGPSRRRGPPRRWPTRARPRGPGWR